MTKVISLVLLFGLSGATIVYVPNPYQAIQFGLDVAGPDDTVLVAPGIYHENLVWPATPGIDLLSEMGAEYTVIDGDSTGRVIEISTGVGPGTVIRGFTLRNGFHNECGAGILAMESSPTILDNIFSHNHTVGDGGALYVEEGTGPIEGNVFESNTAGDGGAVFLVHAYPEVRGNGLHSNSAGRGGAMVLCSASPLLESNVFLENFAVNLGGALYGEVADFPVDPMITMNCFMGNAMASGGNAIWMGAQAAPVIASNDFTANGHAIVVGEGATGDIIAWDNWWGDPSGPYHPSLNPLGLGDSVSDYVDFSPWMSDPATLVCGDADGNADVTPADGYFILNYLGSGPQPVLCWQANVNGDDALTPSDGYHLLNYLGVGPELNCRFCSF
jgi:hypothetical protein